MPITKSAKKAMRRDRRRKKINLLVKERMKKNLKAVRKDPKQSSLAEAFSALDRAAKKKIIHKNKAARLKARLSKHVNKKPSK